MLGDIIEFSVFFFKGECLSFRLSVTQTAPPPPSGRTYRTCTSPLPYAVTDVGLTFLFFTPIEGFAACNAQSKAICVPTHAVFRIWSVFPDDPITSQIQNPCRDRLWQPFSIKCTSAVGFNYKWRCHANSTKKMLT